MSDAFWAMVGVVAPVFILNLFQYLATLRNGKKSAEGREEIKCQVAAVKAEVADVKQTAERSKEEIDLAKTGAFRKGHEAGMERAKTDFGGLGNK